MAILGWAFVATMLLSSCRLQTAAPIATQTVDAALPREVVQFQKRWETCWHFRGEEGYNEERRKELETAVSASCPENEQRLKVLEEKYVGNPAVEKALRALAKMQ